jgi:NAD(P)-dependent dehydrogenase (short-subunit alcohol dehydrogenase family)
MAEQVWFVTGALRGLGRSVVEQALGAGHRVVGGARRVDALSEFGQSHPGRFLALPLDVTDAARAQSAIGETVSGFGRLDVVVINAGYANIAPIEEIDLDDFRSQFDAVFLGTVYVTKAALPVFHAQGSGHFIQVASIGGRLTSPGLSAYQAAKFAVEGFCGVLAQEVAGFGITVTLAEPGAMRTDWAGSSMAVAQRSPDYAPTVGVMAARLHAANGTEPIDPDKVARAFVQIAELNAPRCTCFPARTPSTSPPPRCKRPSKKTSSGPNSAARSTSTPPAWTSQSIDRHRPAGEG